jgi:hypothetical protein
VHHPSCRTSETIPGTHRPNLCRVPLSPQVKDGFFGPSTARLPLLLPALAPPDHRLQLHPSREVYLARFEMESFLAVPTLPPQLAERFSPLVALLRQQGLIEELTVALLETTLGETPLSATSLVAFIRWFSKYKDEEKVFSSSANRRKLLDRLTFASGDYEVRTLGAE